MNPDADLQGCFERGETLVIDILWHFGGNTRIKADTRERFCEQLRRAYRSLCVESGIPVPEEFR